MSAWTKKKAPIETHQSIEEQTQAFLKAGGKIQQVDSGVTGQEKLSSPKQITLGKKT